MYKIYANNRLIYDSEVDDYKIGKGSVTLETNKSGSFTFSLYPGHFYYDSFIKLKTVITVYKSDKIVFRGRCLNDVTDYWNNKVITCEGELGFLGDSVIRPFEFNGTPADLFVKFVEEHNAQVDDFKKFKIGVVTVTDPNNYIARSNSKYESTLSNLNSRLIEDSLGGYFFITHGEDGTDEIPTLNYLADFTNVSTQAIEFGSNLKNYTKTVTAEEIATAIVPLGAEIDDGDDETENKRLTIGSVNNGLDYVFDPAAVAMYGWVCKVVEWDDVTTPTALKAKAEAYLAKAVEQNITIEINAIDLHLLDRSIESFKLGDYIPVTSEPHNFNATLLCQKLTMDLLKPENDTLTLGHTYSTFTEYANQLSGYNKAISDSELKVLKKISNHDKAQQRLTSLMAQALGVFSSEEKLGDGSTIYYLHDQPVLAKSKTIWKMTGDAYAVSTDGGKTWNAGLDSSGNLLVNVLSAIGVSAEWIDVDNLSAISTNIAGWQIDDEGIYKESVDSADPNRVLRTYIRPPTSETTLLNEGAFVRILRSTDGGVTFYEAFAIHPNLIHMYNDDGSEHTLIRSDYIGVGAIQIRERNIQIGDTDNDDAIVSVTNKGIRCTLLSTLRDIFRLAYDDYEGEAKISINGATGYTGDVFISDATGSDITLTFSGGVLVGVEGQ